ncbi:unnamed protein product [Rotaria sordida]|uniref:TNFR-Cys domain-containing protein n=1 Tax=Rotaria sordida TaxID=392033 RepID=A0A819E4R7_9BILA|nr:unnamed protein product [Rotaria sordida]
MLDHMIVKKCPAGYFCSRRDQEPVPCNPEEVSSERYTACSKCSLGYYSAINGSSAGCECSRVDQEPIPTRCYACPLDHSCADSQLCPKSCTEGTYASEPDSISCFDCDGKCSNVTRLFKCESCVQAKSVNCTEGQYVPVYTCIMN